MTVSYTGDVANGSSFGCFWKILYRWRGSVYKLIWRELIAYLCLYYFINFFYRFGLDDAQKTTFEKVKVYCRKNIESIPMSFVLGFYVTLIVKRWWDQYWILPMPDSLALYISASLQGQDERGRLLRRTIMRYTMLAYIICLQRISFRVKKRFPTMTHLVESGLMTESEMKIYEKMDQKAKVLKFWMPVVWASNLVNRARLEGRIQSDHMVQTVITELSDFRRKLGRVMVYDNVSVPLVYTQVVTLAVYTYFLAALIGRQWVNPREEELIAVVYPGYNLDLYFPIFLSLQFIFYIGWLKVAETLINPFGEDDDDFELNWLIDRHIKVSYMVVDEMHEEHPELLKDQYWEQVVPQNLPYNIASERYRKNEPEGSTASLKVNPNESVYADLSSVKRHSTIPDDVYAEYESVAESPLADGRKNWLQRQLSRVESFRSTSSSSSLFMRNRANSAVNGGLGLGYHGHHRPSLYERLMNRRSSKDARHSNRGIHRTTANSLNVPEKGFIPNSRPRVPTPDVTKESQLNNQLHLHVSTASPVPITKVANRIQYTNSDGTILPPAVNPGYAPVTPNAPLYAKGKQAPGNTTSQLKNSYPPQQPPLPAAPTLAPALPASNASTAAAKANNPPTPPPPYDTSAGSPANAMMLSTIAENDCSPYSTSSTNHANNSNVYPTTTSIFGRKPSPPPLDELPPVPVLMVSSPHSSKNSSLSHKSERDFTVRSHPGGGNTSAGLDNMAFNGDVRARHIQGIEMSGRVNEGYETDEGDDGRRYMTIAEVNESRADFERTLTVLPLQQPSPVLPEERHRKTSSMLGPGPVTSEVAPMPVRHGIGSMLRQDAVCIGDMDSDIMIPTSITQTELPPLPIESTAPAPPPNLHGRSSPPKQGNLEIDNDDDGYHERGSYSEDDDASNHSDKGGGSGVKETKHPLNTLAHSESLTNLNSQLAGMPSHLVGHSSSSVIDMEEVEPRSHSADTLKSNASDSDSHGSTFSVDQTLPIPSRQKAIRRRQSQPDTSVPKTDSATNPSALSETEKTSPPTEISKDCEVFV